MHLHIIGSVTLSQIFVRGVRGSTDSLVLMHGLIRMREIEEIKLRPSKKEIFVCEIPGGQKNVHQAGRESFFPNIQTN